MQTFRSFFQTYNTLSELCFNACVWDFGTSGVRNKEDRCVMRCTKQYLDATKEIGKSFVQGHENVLAANVAGQK